ncbi:hypothetical protein HYZ70_00985, partial [Candidatus Curtissbacteria bacterium]|nr:hypothetical protein [Candidatus Curtissbacteria bacterium]
MKKILLSLLTIGVVGGLAFGATRAFFSDTETSKDNIFEAGELDLEIDNTSYLNGKLREDLSWDLRDLTDELFFNYKDLKPGDEGEDTISLHVTNDSWACVDLSITKNDDNGCTDPELIDDPDCDKGDDFDGELADQLEFMFWADDGDNVLEDNERILTNGLASEVLKSVTWTLADSGGNVFVGSGPLIASNTYFIGKAWCYGDLTEKPVPARESVSPAVDPGVNCDGSLVNNASQTDVLTGDVSFEAVQWRNNPDFLCNPPEPTATPT